MHDRAARKLTLGSRHSPGAHGLRKIAITAFRRPYLFKAMLESLLANDLDGWGSLIQVEPSPVADEIIGIAQDLLGERDVNVSVNPQRLGVRANPYSLMERAFAAGSDYVLYLEEDLLLAPDATRVAEWFAVNHRPNWLCLNLIAGGCASAGLLSNPDHPSLLFEGTTFNSLGFAVRREEWQRLMAPAWMTERPDIVKYDGVPTGGWDWQIYALLLDDRRLRSLQPVLARASHNGRLAGEHCPPWFHDRAFAGIPVYDGIAPVSGYRLHAHDDLPSPVRRHAALWEEVTAALRAMTRARRNG